MKAVLERDVEFVEQFGPGLLGQRVSEQSSSIVDGLGPSLGGLFRTLASLITGVVVGILSVVVFHMIYE